MPSELKMVGTGSWFLADWWTMFAASFERWSGAVLVNA